MGFFGMDQSGKTAANNLAGYGQWANQQGQGWAGRADPQWQAGDTLDRGISSYRIDQLQNGTAPVQQMQQYGQQIQPDLDPTLQANQARTQQTVSDWQNNAQPQTQAAVDRMNANNTSAAGNISRTYDQNQGTLNSDYGANTGIASGIHGDIGGNIKDNFGALDTNTNNAYGSLRGDNARTMGGLQNDAASAFDAQNQNVQMLRPGGEFQTAQTARSYAPEVSQTAGNLRRSGIDASSPQAASIMAGAYRDRAAGMDAAAANGTNNYVNAANQVSSARLQNNQNLAQSRLGNESDLQQKQLNTTNSIGAQQGQAFRDEQNRYGQQEIGLNQGQAANTINNRNAAYGQSQQWLDQNTQNALNERNMKQQDWQTGANLNAAQNAQGLNDAALRDQRFQQGNAYGLQDQATKNNAADALQGQANDAHLRSLQAGQLGLQYGQSGANVNQNLYDTAAGNAGWGTKMLIGAGAQLGSAFLSAP